jgi:methylenetetrahydrofolate reductase (NADPH)
MTDVASPSPDGHRAPKTTETTEVKTTEVKTTEVKTTEIKTPAISFEFFPPKTEEMERNLWDTINRLAPLAPNFVSVTYGAGGSTRERTHSTITRILKETELLPAAHLTCVGASRGEIDEIVDRYHDVGVRHIVALRGDPTTGIGTAYVAHPEGYKTSFDLVAAI